MERNFEWNQMSVYLLQPNNLILQGQPGPRVQGQRCLLKSQMGAINGLVLSGFLAWGPTRPTRPGALPAQDLVPAWQNGRGGAAAPLLPPLWHPSGSLR